MTGLDVLQDDVYRCCCNAGKNIGESLCLEEVEDDVVLMKDRPGRVIGFERLNYLSRKQCVEGSNIPVEVQVF